MIPGRVLLSKSTNDGGSSFFLRCASSCRDRSIIEIFMDFLGAFFFCLFNSRKKNIFVLFLFFSNCAGEFLLLSPLTRTPRQRVVSCVFCPGMPPPPPSHPAHMGVVDWFSTEG